SRGENHKDGLFVPLLLLKRSNQFQSFTVSTLFRGRLLLASRFHRWSTPLGLGRSRRLAAARARGNFTALPALRQDQLDMRNATLIPVCAPLWRRTNPLHARTVVRDGTLHVQVVELDIQSFLSREKVRVVERRLQQFADVRRHALLGKCQRVARL